MMDGEQSGVPGRVAAWVAVIAGAAVLCWPAVLNGYPLVFADSGNYLAQALLHFVGWNAPPFYSLFLLATDLRLTLWLPVLAQGLIVAWVLRLVLRELGWREPAALFAGCVLLGAVTTLPWFVSLLTTDVFTGVVVLTLWLLAFGRLGRWERRFAALLAIGAVVVHLSHLPLALGLAIMGGALAAVLGGARAGLRAFGRMALAPAVAALLLLGVNLAVHRTASLAPYSSVVTLARFIGDGTARDYLRAACPTRHYRICPYLDRLGPGGNDFLWHQPVMTELGGAEKWAPEAGAIVRGTVAREPGAVAAAVLRNSVLIFGHLWLRDALVPWRGSPGPEPVIARFFPWEHAAYRHAAQAEGRLQHQAGVLAPVEVAFAWLGLALLLALIVRPPRRDAAWVLCVLVLAAVLGNAVITAGLSGVEDRYESRIAWLLPFTAAAVVAMRQRWSRSALAGHRFAGSGSFLSGRP